MYSAAMLPPAPGLFSTMIVRLTTARIFSAKYRTITSAPLPAGNAQTKRMSWLGYSWATTPAGTTESAAASSIPRVEMRCMHSSLDIARPARETNCAPVAKLLRLDLGGPDISFPVLDALLEQRLAFLGRGDEGIAAEAVQELSRLFGSEDLVEPLVDLIDDRPRSS